MPASGLRGGAYFHFHADRGNERVYRSRDAHGLEIEVPPGLVDYVLPKQELNGKFIVFRHGSTEVLGYPVGIVDPKKYQRNMFQYNMCLVVDMPDADQWQYYAAVVKLAEYLQSLELELSLLSDESKRDQLFSLFDQIFAHLVAHRFCKIPVTDSTTVCIRIARKPATHLPHHLGTHLPPPSGGAGGTTTMAFEDLLLPPPPVTLECRTYHAPMLLFDPQRAPSGPERHGQLDHAATQVVGYVNGFNSVNKIAVLANVDISVVEGVINDLVAYGMVKLLPPFLYSARYGPTPRLATLQENRDLLHKLCRLVATKAGAKAGSPKVASEETLSKSIGDSHSTKADSATDVSVKPGTEEVARLMMLNNGSSGSIASLVANATRTEEHPRPKYETPSHRSPPPPQKHSQSNHRSPPPQQKHSQSGAPHPNDVYRLLCSFDRSLPVKDWVLRNCPARFGVDERLLIQLSVFHGHLRRLFAYPKALADTEDHWDLPFPMAKFSGDKCVEELFVEYLQLEAPVLTFEGFLGLLEGSPCVTLFWK